MIDYAETLTNLDTAIAAERDAETRRGLVAIRRHLAGLASRPKLENDDDA